MRNHVQNVLAKLDAHSKLEALSVAIREGLIDRRERPGMTAETPATRTSASTSPGRRREADLELYRAFVDAAPQFIALAGLDGSVIYVNPGGRRLAGHPGRRRRHRDDDRGLPHPRRARRQRRDRAARRPARRPVEGETTLRHWPTGEGIPVRVASFLVTDPETGAPMALATVQSDLREVVAARGRCSARSPTSAACCCTCTRPRRPSGSGSPGTSTTTRSR